MELPEPNEKLIRLTLARLERISADSAWAHRASGVRGALFKTQSQFEMGETIDPLSLEANLAVAFQILERAAQGQRSAPRHLKMENRSI